MKKIICYGDSNTFGFNPKDGSRFDEKTRWTALLQTNLDADYQIIEEGGCDRTGFVNNPKGFLFSAQRHFTKILSRNEEFDLIILSIGTNDLQFQYDIKFGAAEKGLENLIQIAQKHTNNIILIPPVILSEKILDGFFSFQFDETSIVKSKKIGKIYKQLANIYSCKIFDINKFAQPSDDDGLHYDAATHKIIAEKLCNFIKEI